MLSFLLVFISAVQADFSVLSYNVQNLFDDEHTKGHKDYAYLSKKNPLKEECHKVKNSYFKKECLKTDWNKDKIKQRIELILKVIGESPKKISLLALVEIETEELAKEIGKNFSLTGLAMTEGHDKRGIQSALLFDPKVWKYVGKNTFEFSFATRDLLKVDLLHKKMKKKVSVFVNHWPSQRSPTERRIEVAKVLLRESKKAQKSGHSVMAVGDFNTTSEERPHPFHNILFPFYKEASYEGGTYFYSRKMVWNKLDRVFYQGDLKAIEAKVLKPSFATGVFEYTRKDSLYWGSRVVGTPKKVKMTAKKMKGASDHFPVFVQFNWQN